MKIYIIPQKISNTGSIHDIASSQFDREVKFPAGHKYAIVLASYYGGKGYTTHKSEQAAILQSKKMTDWSHQIIDANGNCYVIDPIHGLIAEGE